MDPTASDEQHDDKAVSGEQPIAFDVDHGAETELRRLLSTRHLTMIALGSSIGMGLWLGSGKSLASGGPAGIFIGYLLAGSMIWSVSHSIGEMAVMYPLPSAFVQWTAKFICPSAAFALGWAYWFSYAITVANELQVSSDKHSPYVIVSLTSFIGCCDSSGLLDR
jgi:amino acid transporter